VRPNYERVGVTVFGPPEKEAALVGGLVILVSQIMTCRDSVLDVWFGFNVDWFAGFAMEFSQEAVEPIGMGFEEADQFCA
jgi:hypothetical protein